MNYNVLLALVLLILIQIKISGQNDTLNYSGNIYTLNQSRSIVQGEPRNRDTVNHSISINVLKNENDLRISTLYGSVQIKTCFVIRDSIIHSRNCEEDNEYDYKYSISRLVLMGIFPSLNFERYIPRMKHDISKHESEIVDEGTFRKSGKIWNYYDLTGYDYIVSGRLAEDNYSSEEFECKATLDIGTAAIASFTKIQYGINLKRTK